MYTSDLRKLAEGGPALELHKVDWALSPFSPTPVVKLQRAVQHAAGSCFLGWLLNVIPDWGPIPDAERLTHCG